MEQQMKLRDAVDLFNEIDLIADLDIRKERLEKARFLNRQGAIVADNAASQGQTGKFGVEAICALRMGLALYDLGLETKSVFKVLKDIHHPIRPNRPETAPKQTLDTITAIRKGDDVNLTVTSSIFSGTKNQHVRFERNGIVLTPTGNGQSERMDHLEKPVGRLVLPATKLLGPIITVFEQMEG